MAKVVKLELTPEQAELIMSALTDKMTSDHGSLKERQDRYRDCRSLHDIIEDALDDTD